MPDEKIIKFEAKKKKKQPPVFGKRDAQSLINKLAKDSSRILIPELEHAEEQAEHRDFTRNEVIEILREGIITEDPFLKNGRWRYKVECARFRSHPFGAAVVTIIREKEKDLLVVTVMWLDKR